MGSDAAFMALSTNATGYLIRRNSKVATAGARGRGHRRRVPDPGQPKGQERPGDNMPEKYDVPVKITAQPRFDVAVV
jgi:hypothetical protein